MKPLDNQDKLFISQQSNSVSTSGAGHSFEVEVQTLFAILMLAHGRVPGFPNSEIIEIDQQIRVKGWNIDDFMLVLQNLDSQKQHNIFFQVKRSFDISDNKEFREIIRAAYSDFCDERFDRKHDILVLFCGNVSCDDLELLSSVHDQSEAQISAESFFSKIRVQGFKSEQFRKTVQIIDNIIKDCKKEATDEEVYSFLKCFRIWSVDLHLNDGFARALMYSFISYVAPNTSPRIVWSTVYEYMDKKNKDSSEIRQESFSDDIKKFFAVDNRKKMPISYLTNNKDISSSQLSLLINKINERNLLAPFLLALLIGGWNERSDKDKSFVASVTKREYDSWKQDLIALHHEFPKVISFKNDEWIILHRRKLLPLLKEDLFEDVLILFEEASVNALLEVNPEFDYPTNARFFQGKRNEKNYSVRIRASIAETLSIIGNMSKPQNYSYQLFIKSLTMRIIRYGAV